MIQEIIDHATQEHVADVQLANLDEALGQSSTMMESICRLAELKAQFTRATLNDALDPALKTVATPQNWLAADARGR
ncbi:hypothetical protein PWR63_30295 [Paraburkholderia sp. A2WS-5]|uniref:hypothetical protein n=1 Tax=unclassified Paraburkholderia TaxID=2615204 RepID=UPI003B7DCC89